MIKKLAILILLLFPTVCFGADPILNFSDIIDGPNVGLTDDQVTNQGAIVTVWGNNLIDGSYNASTHKVYVGSNGSGWTEVAHIYYWCNADGGTSGGGPADLYTYHKMQEIAFSISSSTATGAQKIRITNDGGSTYSNELDFYVRSSGSFVFFSPSGDDADSGTFTEPKQNILEYAADGDTVTAGTIMYLMGTYTESSEYNMSRSGGAVNNMIALITYPGATSLFSYGTGPIDNYNNGGYWTLSKIGATCHGAGIEGISNGRIIGCEIYGDGSAYYTGQAGFIDAGANFYISTGYETIDNLKVFGNYLHDQPTPDSNKSHTTYFRIRSDTRTLNAPEIAWNYLDDNECRFGIHYYDESNDCIGVGGDGQPCVGTFVDTMKIHHNVIKDQVGPGINVYVSEVSEVFDSDIYVYTNLLINCGIPGVYDNARAISFAGGGFQGDIKAYNNTIIGYDTDGVGLAVPNIDNHDLLNSEFGGTYSWINNIIVDTTDAPLYDEGYLHVAQTMTNNVWYDPDETYSAPVGDSNPYETNPNLTNYIPQSPSDAIDGGYNASGVVTDVIGDYDLQGNSWGTLDIGALGNDVDETAPTPSSSSINGNTLSFTASKSIVTTGYDSGDCVVTGTTTGAVNVTSWTGSGASRTSTLATAMVNGETVTMACTLGTDDIEDESGNDMESFSDFEVTNNTPDLTSSGKFMGSGPFTWN